MSTGVNDPTVPEAMALGELVRDQPAAATLFERLGLDFCCGGAQTLEEACTERGLDATTVMVMLDSLAATPETVPSTEHDLSGASITEICDHIVTAHHDRLRSSFETLTELVEKVVRVHGPDHPELAELDRRFATMRDDLIDHAEREEKDLFPVCRELDLGDDPVSFNAGMLELLMDDHQATGAELAAIRGTCLDYDPDKAFCGTHRQMLKNLHEFELDTHQHVHEENNILFPMVRERLAAQ